MAPPSIVAAVNLLIAVHVFAVPYSAVIAAVIAASNETKIYINRIQRNGKRDRNTEEQLSRLWASAAVPLRIVNKEILLGASTKKPVHSLKI